MVLRFGRLGMRARVFGTVWLRSVARIVVRVRLARRWLRLAWYQLRLAWCGRSKGSKQDRLNVDALFLDCALLSRVERTLDGTMDSAMTWGRLVPVRSVPFRAARVCSVVTPYILFLAPPTRITANCAASVGVAWQILRGRRHHGRGLGWARTRRIEALIVFGRIGR